MANLIQYPAAIDACYGPVIFTLDNMAATDSFFILEVWDDVPGGAGSNKWATLHQSPNLNGTAIFDIENILQSFVKVNKEDFDRLGEFGYDSNFDLSQPYILSDAALESNRYYVRYGSTIAVGTEPTEWSGTSGIYNYMNGFKPEWQRLFDDVVNEWGDIQIPKYRPTVSGDCEGAFNCTDVISRQRPLSDNRDELFAQDTGLTYIDEIKPLMKVNRHYVAPTDYATKSWINELLFTECVPGAVVQGIEGFRYTFYNGNTVASDIIIPNVQTNGGGPNASVNDGTAVAYPYKFISQGTGPANLVDVSWQFGAGLPVQTFRIGDLQNWTHYWVYPVPSAGGSPDCADRDGISLVPLGDPQLYIRKDRDCLDYDHIQFSWLNSFGFRDQFTFRKKNEKTIKTKRNTYEASNYDPNAVKWSSDPEYRGQTVYSSTNEITYTVMSDYMSDEQARTLETLFSSPDVRVEIPLALDDDQPGYAYAAFQAAIITSSSYTKRTYRKDNLFQYEITFKLATNKNVQRG